VEAAQEPGIRFAPDAGSPMAEAARKQRDGAGSLEALHERIAHFHASSVQLAREYRRLEERMERLGGELQAKNAELEASLRALEKARGHLVSILESLKAGVLVLDRALVPTLANGAFAQLAGAADRRLVEWLLGEELIARLRAGETGILPLECERTVRRPEGEAVPVRLTLSELAGAEERDGYVLVLQDLGPLRRLEAEAARAQRLAALGVMVAEVSHQIRSPLGAIELYASLLKEPGRREPEKLAEEILGAARRLNGTISRLLSFAAEPALAAEELPVSSLLYDLEAAVAPLFGDGAWALEIRLAPGLPPIWGDRELLVQALLNLVSNAIEAMPQGGWVKVGARLSPYSSLAGALRRTVEIHVADEGVGIPARDREKIFVPFFTTKPRGTGLGLALTQKVVASHGGAIEVSSGAARGTRFTISLPAGERHARPEAFPC
jgi:signal transduction histidine kinase